MSVFFSVIIPTYNRPDLLGKAIKSVINQAFKNWELIVVGDGAPKATRELATSFADERITYIYQQRQHTSVAKNNGIAHARGRYICFLDDDDWFYDNHLQELREAIEERAYPVAFFYTGVCEHSGAGKIRRRPLPDKPIKNGIEHVTMNTIIPTCSCLHRDIFKHYQFKTEDLPAEDRALWIQVTSEFPVYQVSLYTVAHLKHERQYTVNVSNELSFEVIERGIESIRHLLKSEKIKRAVSKKVVQQFLSRSYYWYMFDAVKNKNRKKAIWFLFKSIWERPFILLTIKPLVALRDIIFINQNL